MKFFGQNLRYLLAIRGETQKDFASTFNLSKSQVSNYTNDISKPTMDLACEICEHFDKSLDDLFRRDLRPTESPPENPPPKLAPVGEALTTEGLTSSSGGRGQPATASPPGIQIEMKALERTVLDAVVKMRQLQDAVEHQGSNFDK